MGILIEKAGPLLTLPLYRATISRGVLLAALVYFLTGQNGVFFRWTLALTPDLIKFKM
jgi:hypothetical protein